MDDEENDCSVVGVKKETSVHPFLSDHDCNSSGDGDKKLFIGNKGHTHESILNACVISLHIDILKEEMSKENNDRFSSMAGLTGNISHMHRHHGSCHTIPGGNMHLFYQLLISIEKATLVPVTYSNKLFKSFLDDYGLRVIDMSSVEEELRVGRILNDFSKCNGSRFEKTTSEVIVEEFKDLLLLSIGVPSYFLYSFKYSFTCYRCRKVSNQKFVQPYLLKLEIKSHVLKTSISELIR